MFLWNTVGALALFFISELSVKQCTHKEVFMTRDEIKKLFPEATDEQISALLSLQNVYACHRR